ncbi:galactokinase [candidate division KSB1 bacterium]|nr:galactokinase [candidate division KSB1 bacterium]
MCLEARISRLKEILKNTYGHEAEAARVLCSPYRICPLGAHVDHQHGVVTGMCIDRSVLMVYAPNYRQEMQLESLNYAGKTHFSFEECCQPQEKHWGNYAKGAVFALQKNFKIETGFDGIIEGNLPVGGLSSSAAVGLAYLMALEDVNGLNVSREENIFLDQAIENEFIGLHNGILDQSTILMSHKCKLFYLDCETTKYDIIDPGSNIPEFKIIVVYSGLSAALSGTGYNRRVLECREATQMFLEKAGLEVQPDSVLKDVPEDIYEKYKHELPLNLRKRAEHVFSENRRVKQGVDLWEKGDLVQFGQLINASGLSSIENYEAGSPHLISIYEILAAQPGVYGARFSGGGFRGSCIGLIDPKYADQIKATVAEAYPKKHVDIKDSYEIFICDSDEGVRFI